MFTGNKITIISYFSPLFLLLSWKLYTKIYLNRKISRLAKLMSSLINVIIYNDFTVSEKTVNMYDYFSRVQIKDIFRILEPRINQQDIIINIGFSQSLLY